MTIVAADERLNLRRALTAFKHPRTPSKIAALLRSDGAGRLDEIFSGFTGALRDEVEAKVDQVLDRGIRALIVGQEDYPVSLILLPSPPPVLFVWGDVGLLSSPGISMCGSRNAGPLGLKAATSCGREVARQEMLVVSGYAKGVDTETHLAALAENGKTVIVLAEGIEHFRVKRAFASGQLTQDRAVVVSQFAPSQTWSAGAAMTRNAVIVGLGRALVVVDAGERGGTIAAGRQALRVGKPVLVLDFGDETPPGNKMLLDDGAVRVSSREELGEIVADLRTRMVEVDCPRQLVLG